ncbi:unnamed protein product [Discosporangium mesarthrocarpum]
MLILIAFAGIWLWFPLRVESFLQFPQLRPRVVRLKTSETHHAFQTLAPVRMPQNKFELAELDAGGKIMLKGMEFSELEDLMSVLGEKRERAVVVSRCLYQSRRLIRDIDEAAVDDVGRGKYRLGQGIRNKLRAVVTADGGLELEDVKLAMDGTRKMVSRLTSGEGAGKQVETVIIPMVGGRKKAARYTVCVSSQVGCAMNCQFCYTGRLGLMANLQTAQMVEQVIYAKRYLESVGDLAPLTGVVYMGMGEPFDNYDRVMKSVKILTDPREGVRLSAGRVTVSTVGLVPQIERFCSDPNNRALMAVSLHASTDQVRDQLIPVNRRYPLQDLFAVLRKHFPKRLQSRCPPHALSPNIKPARTVMHSDITTKTTKNEKNDGNGQQGPSNKPRHRRILNIEYTLLKGANDSMEDAVRLAELLSEVDCVVNLITFNPHEGTPFAASSRETLDNFRSVLTGSGLLCTVRDSRGDDGMAACGQLGGAVIDGMGDRKLIPVAWKPEPESPAVFALPGLQQGLHD